MSSSLQSMPHQDMLDYMAECRKWVLQELETFVPQEGPLGPILYELVYDYPLREAKALRPAVAIAVCRAFGGPLEGVLKSATVLELYHNAFLIHDDVEDGSEMRRDAPTLHRAHGVSIAINVGDAMLALALQPLLANTQDVGLGKSLRIMEAVAKMARESAEGQAIELSWIQKQTWNLRDQDYLRMVHKKTGWYTFITPAVLGGIIAGCDATQLYRLRLLGTALGTAFQIQDDILNLTQHEGRYGKEHLGDLWEGKHTLILMHALRSAPQLERERAAEVLGKLRPDRRHQEETTAAKEAVTRQRDSGELSQKGYEQLSDALFSLPEARYKTEKDVQYLLSLITKQKSIEHATQVATRRARRARTTLQDIALDVGHSEHLEFLQGLIEFVIERTH